MPRPGSATAGLIPQGHTDGSAKTRLNPHRSNAKILCISVSFSVCETSMAKLLRNILTCGLRRLSIEVGHPIPTPTSSADRLIAKWLDAVPELNKYCIDLGAHDGVSASNTFPLFLQGWHGLAVECEPSRFRRLVRAHRLRPYLSLANGKATPNTVVPMLRAFETPDRPGMISLDIDSYDFFVLDALLQSYRPSLLCCEINEKIPPPIHFSVKYDPAWSWAGDYVYGQSISAVGQLCRRHQYSIVDLEYNNAFLMPEEIAPTRLSPEAAYDVGYRNESDRKQRFPWNEAADRWLTAEPAEAIAMIDEHFAVYRGQYELSISTIA